MYTFNDEMRSKKTRTWGGGNNERVGKEHLTKKRKLDRQLVEEEEPENPSCSAGHY